MERRFRGRVLFVRSNQNEGEGTTKGKEKGTGVRHRTPEHRRRQGRRRRRGLGGGPRTRLFQKKTDHVFYQKPKTAGLPTSRSWLGGSEDKRIGRRCVLDGCQACRGTFIGGVVGRRPKDEKRCFFCSLGRAVGFLPRRCAGPGGGAYLFFMASSKSSTLSMARTVLDSLITTGRMTATTRTTRYGTGRGKQENHFL